MSLVTPRGCAFLLAICMVNKYETGREKQIVVGNKNLCLDPGGHSLTETTGILHALTWTPRVMERHLKPIKNNRSHGHLRQRKDIRRIRRVASIATERGGPQKTNEKSQRPKPGLREGHGPTLQGRAHG